MKDTLKNLLLEKERAEHELRAALKGVEYHDDVASKLRGQAQVWSKKAVSLAQSILKLREHEENSSGQRLPDDDDLLREAKGQPSKATEAKLGEMEESIQRLKREINDGPSPTNEEGIAAHERRMAEFEEFKAKVEGDMDKMRREVGRA